MDDHRTELLGKDATLQRLIGLALGGEEESALFADLFVELRRCYGLDVDLINVAITREMLREKTIQ